MAATNLSQTDLLIVWLGTACDRTATLTVTPEVASVQLVEGPRPTCDLAANPRSVVLELSTGVTSSKVELTITRTPVAG